MYKRWITVPAKTFWNFFIKMVSHISVGVVSLLGKEIYPEKVTRWYSFTNVERILNST